VMRLTGGLSKGGFTRSLSTGLGFGSVIVHPLSTVDV
jgi:hypothetical protein